MISVDLKSLKPGDLFTIDEIVYFVVYQDNERMRYISSENVSIETHPYYDFNLVFQTTSVEHYFSCTDCV